MFNQPRGKNVSQSHFAMVPRNDVPRSLFKNRSAHKTTFDAGYLVPMYLNEVLPGDSFRINMTAFARMQPAVFPIMDNLYMDSFWFFVPCRLLWDNWNKFMGERTPFPNSTTDFLTPIMESDFVGTEPGELADYFGLPTSDQLTTLFGGICSLPFRAYQLIYDQWFRDQNLQDSPITSPSFFGDGPDAWSVWNILQRRGKRHDYFTSCLPWPQKGDAAAVPLTGLAPIAGLGISDALLAAPGSTTPTPFYSTASWPGTETYSRWTSLATAATVAIRQVQDGTDNPPSVYADLSQATGALINDLRLAESMQRLLERDARGGTRYTEILRSHFGVIPQDARLQRPEYLGGSSSPIHINPVAQTSETSDTGTPLGQLAGVGTGVHQSGFSQSFTEHGYLMCIVSVRADLTYQQGYHRMWNRRTKYDFYWPAFAHLGEQAVLRQEIYATGDPANDEFVFGYQERWAEYRYFPSKITGLFRSGVTGTLDAWHLAQEFASAPLLDDAFIVENPPMERVLAGAEETVNQQFLFDSVFDANVVRPMPTYSVPGLGGRF